MSMVDKVRYQTVVCVHTGSDLGGQKILNFLKCLQLSMNSRLHLTKDRWGESVRRILWCEREQGLAVARLDLKIMTSRLALLVVTWGVVIIYLLLQLQLHNYGPQPQSPKHYQPGQLTIFSPQHLTGVWETLIEIGVVANASLSSCLSITKVDDWRPHLYFMVSPLKSFH